jgi:propionyl-CoA synthetase
MSHQNLGKTDFEALKLPQSREGSDRGLLMLRPGANNNVFQTIPCNKLSQNVGACSLAGRYDEIYRQSLEDPSAFWGRAAEKITWYRKWDRVLDTTRPPFYRWFPGGVVNTCYNALDRHVENGRGGQPALIYDSPVTGTIQTFTYSELLDKVAQCGAGLARLGVRKGDRVIIYMPMVPETVIAMLACARIGAVHSVVFGGFASPELAARINDATPKVILSASCGIEVNRIIPYKPLLDAAIELSMAKPERCVVLQRPQLQADLKRGRDLDWTVLEGTDRAECVPVASTDPLYILYTSGTTGIPKGVVRDQGGHMVALHWTMKNIYGVDPGEVFWAASDVGWVVGHSYIVYGPLLAGCTTVLYEGKSVGTPNPGAFWRVISQHGVHVLFTAPTAFRAIKREDPRGDWVKQFDLSAFRMLFLAGERCDPDTLLWAREKLGVPVIDHWWQTETGWAIGANPAGLGLLPVKPGSCTRAMPGYDVRILDEGGHEMEPGQIGSLVLRFPLPPGNLVTLWNNDRDFLRTYCEPYPGYYLTGDAGYIDEDRYLWIMSRTDDIINTAGHRLSTGAIEEVLASHPDVAECAVTGVKDAVKGEIPLGFIVPKAGVTRSPETILQELIQMVRDKIGPITSFKVATFVKRLPKTRSGKILRGTMKKIADGEPFRMPATIDDPAILEEIRTSLVSIGYPEREE